MLPCVFQMSTRTSRCPCATSHFNSVRLFLQQHTNKTYTTRPYNEIIMSWYFQIIKYVFYTFKMQSVSAWQQGSSMEISAVTSRVLKWSINPISNPNPVYNHAQSRNNIMSVVYLTILHTLQIITAHAKSFQSAVSSPVVPWYWLLTVEVLQLPLALSCTD
jgi:hypothetical protein